MTPELSRPVPLAKIGRMGLGFEVRASPEECVAVAARMDLPAVQSLTCSFQLTAGDDGVSVLAEGRLHVEVTRICVASAEEFETLVEDEFVVRFVPAGSERDDPDPDLPDEIPYTADTIDLGEAATEQLGLALDPYPRIDGATIPAIDDEDDTSPFAILAQRGAASQTRQ